ncbi:hypothetical protein IHN63_20700, partial [Deinococcus sp. 6YEL10]|nr:hypothetical protein [Deinococcus sp. 6YEL10]
ASAARAVQEALGLSALTATFLPEADRRAAQAAREYGEALARQERD